MLRLTQLPAGRYLCRQIIWGDETGIRTAGLYYLETENNRVVLYPFDRELANTPFIEGAVILLNSSLNHTLMHYAKNSANPHEFALLCNLNGYIANLYSSNCVALHCQ